MHRPSSHSENSEAPRVPRESEREEHALLNRYLVPIVDINQPESSRRNCSEDILSCCRSQRAVFSPQRVASGLRSQEASVRIGRDRLTRSRALNKSPALSVTSCFTWTWHKPRVAAFVFSPIEIVIAEIYTSSAADQRASQTHGAPTEHAESQPADKPMHPPGKPYRQSDAADEPQSWLSDRII